jgi:hypothetical protein
MHYLLIFHPLPSWPGIFDVIPRGLTRLAGEAYFIGTVIVLGSVWWAMRNERRRRATEAVTATATEPERQVA